MKRPRSYEDDPDDKEKAGSSFKDWDHRHHRRFYDEDRDSSRSSRRRFDHGSFDRYRDGAASSSPHSSGGGERLHRSESFSALRRDFPKGFRSERSGRDRFRREGSSSGGSSWQQRRSGGEKEAAAAASTADLGSSQSRRHSRSVDSSNGEQEKTEERTPRREEKVNRESCSSSEMEMEEGELEPEPEPEAAPVGVNPDPEAEKCEDRGGIEEEKKVESREEDGEDRQEIEETLVDSDGGTSGGKEEEGQVGESDQDKELNEQKVQEEGQINLSEEKKEIGEDENKVEETVDEENKEGEASIQDEKQVDDQGVVKYVEGSGNRDGIDVDDVENKERRGIDLEAEPEGAIPESDNDDKATLELMTDKIQETYQDKGKSIAVFDSNKEDYFENWDIGEGPSSRRGFELVFPCDSRTNSGGVAIGKNKDDKPKLEPLDLSLGLPGVLPKPSSPSRAKSFQSLPSSFRTNSDGFTNSISFSGSQTFVHNPSCSLTQNSLDNFEQSVGSHPIFQGVDQVSNASTIWQAQTSNEPKLKGGSGSLFQRILMNGNSTHNSLQAQNFHHSSKPDNLSRHLSLPRQLSPTQSHGSRDTKSEHSKDKRFLTRERSSSNLFRSEQQDGEQLVLNGGGFERIIAKIVSEPLQVVGRIFQQMTDQSITYLKESISEMISTTEKHGKLNTLQEVLQRRSDLTTETLSKCHRNLLEILVALKTGLTDFLRRGPNIVPSSYVVETFFNMKCRNISCRNLLPVDDCDCKVCVQKSGFCSACMCLVCSKFDTASNTCSWVGCDLCLHWCHTDCGLRDSHIRYGPISGAQGMTEMQFHCVACDHPSEMFGFVKDVFKTCAKSWKVEILAKELQYVRRIFSASNDAKGKKLCGIADRMLGKLEDKANLSEIINYIMGFFSDSEQNTNSSPSTLPPKEPSRNNVEVSNGIAQPIKKATWLPSSSYCAEKIPLLENTRVLPNPDCEAIQVGRLARDSELPSIPKKNSVVDELESVVRFKQAEAKMYQERADSARREAEGLKRIAVAKNVKIEEEYNTRIARLRLLEAEERRKQKLEQLQVIERAHREFFNMKMRMESEIKDLLLKMEGTKRNVNS